MEFDELKNVNEMLGGYCERFRSILKDAQGEDTDQRIEDLMQRIDREESNS